VHEMIAKLPCWQGAWTAEPLSGGLSNEIWKVTDEVGAHVVRFGDDYPFHCVDRAREAMSARAAHALGVGPEIEFNAPGVMVTAWLEGRTWAAEDVRARPEAVAALLRNFHHGMPVHVSGPGYIFWPFHIVRDYARQLAGTRHEDCLAGFLALNAEMEAVQVPLPIIYGHHDLLPANFIGDGERPWLIDYEYAGYGTAMFDLAGAASNAEMTQDQSDRLVTAYLGHAPGPDFRRAFAAMQCVSLVREAMWSMVSEGHLSTPGVDFDAYAAENIARLDSVLDRYRQEFGAEK
jgi:thiamine kinase-like enzyme